MNFISLFLFILEIVYCSVSRLCTFRFCWSTSSSSLFLFFLSWFLNAFGAESNNIEQHHIGICVCWQYDNSVYKIPYTQDITSVLSAVDFSFVLSCQQQSTPNLCSKEEKSFFSSFLFPFETHSYSVAAYLNFFSLQIFFFLSFLVAKFVSLSHGFWIQQFHLIWMNYIFDWS